MKKTARAAGIAACWILVWQLIAMAVGSELLLPSPWRTLLSLGALLTRASFYKSAGMTLARIGGGFLSGMLLGTLLGVLTAFSRAAEAFLAPLRSVVKTTPVSSFIVLVLLYLSNTLTPLFIAFLMVTPIAWISTQQAVRGVDKQLLEMAACYHLDRQAIFRYIYLPSVLPQYLAVSTTALSIAWKSGIAAEVVATPAFSIGRSIYESKIYLETPTLFAWTAAVILISAALEKIMVRALSALERRFFGAPCGSLRVRPLRPAEAAVQDVTLSHIHVSFGDKAVLKDLCAVLPARGTVAVLGPSGGGKTTLLRLLAGVQKPDSGTVSGLEGKRVAYMFQEDRLLPWLTALQNVTLVCGDEARARALLAAMELAGDATLRPDALSGGMRRRVALARALAYAGDVLLLDEPFKGMDEALRLRVTKSVRNAAPLIVIAAHEAAEAAALGRTESLVLG